MLNTPRTEEFDKNKFLFTAFIVLLLLISLFINLGVHPLYLEEPRRALIALEMLYNKNLIVPTEFGEYYYKKPPLYNWMIILSFKIFGSYSEFACRFFSALSFILMGVVLFFVGKKYASLTFGIYSSLLFLVSIDILYYFSVLGEIDIFYSLITLLSFFSIFHFYEQKQYTLLFVFTYLFGAFGTLTKGLPSIVFLAISIPVFFLYKKDFKKLFTYHHLFGIIAYLSIAGGYFYWYSIYNSPYGYLTDLWSQSSERTLIEKSVLSLLGHLFNFPLEVIKNVLPASLFIPFLFRKDFMHRIRENKLIEFCFYIFLSNILIYWISPGTRARYVYMLYPLFIMILLYFYLINTYTFRQKVIFVIIGIVIALGILICMTLPFIPLFKGLDYIGIVSITCTISLLILLYFYVRVSSYRFLYLIFCLIVMRFVFNFTVIPSRAQKDQQAQIEKDDALKISKMIRRSPLYMYPGIRMSHTSIFYLEGASGKVVPYNADIASKAFFIISENQIPAEQYKVYYEFYSASEKRLLVKIL